MAATISSLLKKCSKWDIRYDRAEREWSAYPAYVSSSCGAHGTTLRAAVELALRRKERAEAGGSHKEIRAVR